MNAKIQKWGNSLAVRLPRSFAAEINLTQGAVVDLKVLNGRLIISPFPKPHYELRALLKRVSKRNIHAEVDTGYSVGLEAW